MNFQFTEQHLASVATDIMGLYGQLLAESRWAPVLGVAPSLVFSFQRV